MGYTIYLNDWLVLHPYYMARTKQYIESEVLEKAMFLFWNNGYENTSMQMLEKEMGINKFSIYASFGSKHGLFLESLKAYKERSKKIFAKLISANNGVEDIKVFFYDSVENCNHADIPNGCLLTNTYNEFHASEDAIIKRKMNEFVSELKQLFIDKLSMDRSKTEETILRQANYLLLAKHGLALASKINSKKEIEDFIETTFNNI